MTIGGTTIPRTTTDRNSKLFRGHGYKTNGSWVKFLKNTVHTIEMNNNKSLLRYNYLKAVYL